MARCGCACHRGTEKDAAPPFDDPVGTITACSQCRDEHFPPPTWEPPKSGVPRVYDPSDDTD